MEPFKNIYNKNSVEYLISLFEQQRLVQARVVLKRCIPELEQMELKQRVHCLKDALREILPANPKKSFKIIDKMLAPLSDRSGLGNSAADTFALNPRGLEGFLLWPFAEYVAEVGIEHIDLSLNILKEITQRFTAEFAIRPFIHRYPKIVYPELLKWTNSESEHVRRLCSEGSRPRLPWGMKLDNAVTDPTQGIELLDKLKYDDSMYVRKSVANHLNDISKDHPDVAINIFKRWIKQVPKMEQAKIEWIIKHAGRGLIKAGHPEMLKLVGVHYDAEIKLTKIKLSTNELKIGSTLLLTACLNNLESKKHRYILDYKIDYIRPSGKKSSKVFKGIKGNIESSKKNIPIELKVPFKNSSIRTHFPGIHTLTLLLNGKESKLLKIILKH